MMPTTSSRWATVKNLDLPPIEANDSKILLSAIVDSSDDAIISKTLNGVITSWNRAAERIFGYTAEEVIGRPITLLIPPERQGEEEMVLENIRRGDKIDHFETVRQTKDGRKLDISLTISPLRNAGGRIVGASKIARDITSQKRLESELEQQIALLKKEVAAREQAQAVLHEALTIRDDFIAVAAHELRNPLNVVVLTWQLLQRLCRDSNRSSEVQNVIEKSRVQLGRLSALVDRLLDVTRIRSGTFELYRETFDLSGLIREVVTRFTIEPAQEVITLDVPPDIVGSWDRVRIDQALTNLISNACKYGKERPIEIKALVEDNCAVVTVQDHGIGIQPEELEKIFERFERVTTNFRKESMGLGLWITKRIVAAHGGSITASSEPDKGSSFTMRLPLQAA